MSISNKVILGSDLQMSVEDGDDFLTHLPDGDMPEVMYSDENFGPADRNYSVQGFFGPDTLSIIRTIPADDVERIFMRVFLVSAKPPTKRRRRLCEQVGHPPSRRAPTYSGAPSPPKLNDDGTVSFDLNDVQLESHYCLRCGSTYDAK